ncbi:MAG: ribosome small subunit-dependent GTPase A, partial [Eubacteriales bacterium]|nr:ribosome small subunit-dependent GTPase A [Eubacteriales bacterium]
MKGKIVKSIAGYYEVHTAEALYRCRARGIFRALGQKPLVGDDVEIDITDTVSDPREGNVRALLPRKNELVRPNVANVDQALLIFAITHPAPSYNMLDRFLITMQERELDAVLCFTKRDIATQEEIDELRSTYEACGCTVLFISSFIPGSLGKLREILRGKTTVLTGPSGAGKSTLINILCPGANMQTGELSRKIRRGKNTTRHVELLPVPDITGEDRPRTPEGNTGEDRPR